MTGSIRKSEPSRLPPRRPRWCYCSTGPCRGGSESSRAGGMWLVWVPSPESGRHWRRHAYRRRLTCLRLGHPRAPVHPRQGGPSLANRRALRGGALNLGISRTSPMETSARRAAQAQTRVSGASCRTPSADVRGLPNGGIWSMLTVPRSDDGRFVWPNGVVPAHLADQFGIVIRNARPPGLTVTDFPRPEESKALPAPCDDGLRLDDRQRRPRAAANPAQPSPEDPARGGQLRRLPG